MGFSPKGGAEALVLRVIDSAKTDIKALSYSFTSPRVVAALLRAAKRGVAVSLVADYKNISSIVEMMYAAYLRLSDLSTIILETSNYWGVLWITKRLQPA